eukprot:TRINITY_DN11482_c0_g1_i1.p1 TRINITY_DN11482_c0_g1~~TRINITY_DN11482_c0_g1_i1.p1  ORF type:complete len:394 (+),score=64.07 TRINITY_DN11482_c0_g1_i1:38-1183(+)
MAALRRAATILNFGGGMQVIGDTSVMEKLRSLKWKAYPEFVDSIAALQEAALFGKSVVKGVTLTPYANAMRCPAHCHYCSEDLQRLHQPVMNSSPKNLIKDFPPYFKSLRSLFNSLRQSGVQVGLSVSGLEATADPAWMQQLLSAASDYTDVFTERVLYTNGAGLVQNPSFADGFARVEWHRDHHVESTNQLLMRLEQQYDIRRNDVFAETVRAVLPRCADVRVVCILSRSGVNSRTEAQQYAAWARDVGFRGVIFRELSQLKAEEFAPSRTLTWIQQNRVPIDSIFAPISSTAATGPKTVTAGYYYYNEIYSGSAFIEEQERNDADKFTVTLEASCYETLEQVTTKDTDVIHKLVFHSNGNLTKGWDRNREIVKLGTTWQ